MFQLISETNIWKTNVAVMDQVLVSINIISHDDDDEKNINGSSIGRTLWIHGNAVWSL